jgi:hypothetical protein
MLTGRKSVIKNVEHCIQQVTCVLELATRKQTLLGLSLFFRDKKEDLQGSYGSSDYMSVLQSEVDKFFNQEMQSKSKETDLVPRSQVR